MWKKHVIELVLKQTLLIFIFISENIKNIIVH